MLIIETEERLLRVDFSAEQGAYLPDDLCLAIENMPTRWDIVPLKHEDFEESSTWKEDYREIIPEVDDDLLTEVFPILQLFSFFLMTPSRPGTGYPPRRH